MADEFPVFPMASLFLPGTVALPSPFPTVGHIWLPTLKQLPGIERDTELVAIGASLPPTTTIVRYVQAKFISAIFLLDKSSDADDSRSINWNKGTWLFAPSFEQIGDALSKRNRAIVYVPESAPVITQGVFGQTAAESAEYIAWRHGPCDCV